ncbi:MAG: purine-nucleoside phosphorylase [Pseudomonadota bacterium]
MSFETYFERVEQSASWLKNKVEIKPHAIIILSAGLDGFVKDVDEAHIVPAEEIPNFPRALAQGHSGCLIFGNMKGVPIVVLSGRFHFYEGHHPADIVLPYFVLEQMGARSLITTNAAGGVNKSFRPGDIMLVTDHINMMGINPLIGIAVQRDEDQFTSLIHAYDENLQKIAQQVARKIGLKLKQGIYLATSGPSYETKAEVTAFRKLGADAVGMSTVPEVIAANFLGLRVLSLSCIANFASDLHEGRMTHAAVLKAMKELAPKAVKLLEGIVEELGKS